MLADDTIRAVLRTSWHLQPDGLTPLTGGMDSSAWSVIQGPNRYVAKSVNYSRRSQLEAGLSASEHLTRLGFAAGAPLRCIDGALSQQVRPVSGLAGLEKADTMEFPAVGLPTSGPSLLVLLDFVEGKPLDRSDPVDQLWWGDRLAACHRALSTFTHAGLSHWQTPRAEAPHRPGHSWLGPAVKRAVEAFEKLTVLDRLTFGCLHGDPQPAAFLLDPATGRVGVVGWGHAGIGPLLYDLASAVMYAGGTTKAGDLLDAYTAAGVVPRAEIESALPTVLQLRWAVRAGHCVRRLAARSTMDDLRSLTEAREALLG